ncbi:MAG: hypothetical protein P4L64_14495 [Caulobacteraceae bacterium]|nr:hypothetical protein [Caulobacteraceae bacterium]
MIGALVLWEIRPLAQEIPGEEATPALAATPKPQLNNERLASKLSPA